MTDEQLLREALEAVEGITKRYCSLANSGDCGFWEPEDVQEVKQARAAITKLEARLLRE